MEGGRVAGAGKEKDRLLIVVTDLHDGVPRSRIERGVLSQSDSGRYNGNNRAIFPSMDARTRLPRISFPRYLARTMFFASFDAVRRRCRHRCTDNDTSR